MIGSEIVVGISGLDAGTNPQPGVAVAHALRADPEFRGRILALPYDPMVGGAYMSELFDDVCLIPWPGDAEAVQLAAMRRARADHGLDLLLPCLDSDMPAVARRADDLAALGIATLAPSEAALKRRFKWNLPELARVAGIETPRTEVLYDVEQLQPIAGWSWPIYIKGSLADAEPAHDREEAAYLFRRMARRWGYPVLAQERRAGIEYLVSGFRDRERRLIGRISLRKGATSASGKALTGVTVVVPELDDIADRLLDALDWVGPFELEFLRESQRESFLLIEINARFPAWISFVGELGLPLMSRAVRAALGERVEEIARPGAGMVFSRAHRRHQGEFAGSAPLRALARSSRSSKS